MGDDQETFYKKYDWQLPLSEGANNTVYLCKDWDNGTRYVIKQLRYRLGDDEAVSEEAIQIRKHRWRLECTILQRLSFPGVAKYVESLEGADGRCFLVLEYVDGDNFRTTISKHGPLGQDDAVKVSIQIAEILEHLHRSEPRIILGNLNPSNFILTPEGNVICVDLRSSHICIMPDAFSTHSAAVYTAPEFSGKPCPQSDFYSLGKFLEFLMTGYEPHSSGSYQRGTVPDLSPAFENLLCHLTALRLEDRPPTAEHVVKSCFQIYKQLNPDFQAPGELDLTDETFISPLYI